MKIPSEFMIDRYKLVYVRHLVENGLHKTVALEIYRAGFDDIDYSVAPEYAADIELSYLS